MIQLQSITTFFQTHGQLRKSQRTTLAALVWTVIRSTLLGSAIIVRHLAMADDITTTAKHTIQRVVRFLGSTRIDLGDRTRGSHRLCPWHCARGVIHPRLGRPEGWGASIAVLKLAAPWSRDSLRLDYRTESLKGSHAGY